MVAIEGRKPRDGRSLEILGFYDPLTDPATVKIETDAAEEATGTAEAEAEPAAAPEASADGDSDGDGEASA